MRLRIDGPFPSRLARWIAETFSVEATTLFELGFRHGTDAAIFEAMRSPGEVIVTKDADFVDLVTRLGPPPQVIWVTCGNVKNQVLRALLTRSLPEVLRMLESGEPIVELAGP